MKAQEAGLSVLYSGNCDAFGMVKSGEKQDQPQTELVWVLQALLSDLAFILKQ